MKYFFLFVFLLLTPFLFTHIVYAANIPVGELPQPIETLYTYDRLNELGCETVPISLNGEVSVPFGKPYYVAPQDVSTTQNYTFCSEETYQVLKQATQGQVAGCSSWMSAASGFPGSQIIVPAGCAASSVAELAGTSIKGEAQAYIIKVYSSLVTISVTIALWFTKVFAYFIGYFLKQGQFITHPFVSRGWIVIQGLANLGFILALLFIAGSTVLQMDVAGTVRKLLPRLLIAALLINFSLVIGGALIDFSRLLMAIEVNAITNGTDIDDIGARLIESSGSFNAIWFATNNDILPVVPKALLGETPDTTAEGWSVLANLMIANFVVWFITIGLGVLAVFLFIRHIALLLLLVASPVAYLAWIFPKTQKIAEKWWSEFLKYVFVGPILLFILILIPRITGGDFTEIINENEGFVDRYVAAIIPVFLTVGAVIGAVIATRALGTAGSQAVVNFANKAGKRAAYYGSGAFIAAGAGRYAGNRIKEQARDFKSSAAKSFRDQAKQNKFTKMLVGGDRDDKGKLKDGEESLGSKLGKKAGTRMGSTIPGRDDKARNAKQVSQAFHGIAAPADRKFFIENASALSPDKLTNAAYATNLSDKLLEAIASEPAGSKELDLRKQALATGLTSAKSISESKLTVLIKGAEAGADTTLLHQIAKNVDIVKKMTDKQRAAILDVRDKDVTKSLLETIRKANAKK